MSDTPELFDKIDLAISEPGSLLYREDGETFVAWSARAVLAVVAPLLAESQAQTANALRWLDQEREFAEGQSESEREKLNQLIDEREAARAEVAQLKSERAMLVAPYVDEEHQGGSWSDIWMRQQVEIERLRREVEFEAHGGEGLGGNEIPLGEVPDWSALRDACDEYCTVYMGEDDSLMPPALDKVRRAMAGEDPYNTPDSEVSGG